MIRPTAAQIGGMLRELPFKTIGDAGRHSLELHVYCPSCYATRLVSTDNTRWRDRLFATARFRCTGKRYTGRPCAGPGVLKIRPHDLLQVGGPVTLAFLGCFAMHLGDRPGPARQAAMVGKPPALSLPWLRSGRRVAHTRANLAAGRAFIDGYRWIGLPRWLCFASHGLQGQTGSRRPRTDLARVVLHLILSL